MAERLLTEKAAHVTLAPTPLNTGVRPCVRGKFLFVGEQKFYIRGATYGTFRPDEEGNQYGSPAVVERDFALMAVSGINTIRIYTVPPRWLLDLAQRHGLCVMVGLPWEQHVAFLDDKRRAQSIEARVRAGVRACAGHPAILCYAIGNEIPAPIVRWYGRRRVERFIRRLYNAAKTEDPQSLITYVNFPTTEYLQLPFVDFICFNVFLESRDRLEAYLARLQNIAGDRPLVLAEVGLDCRRHGEDTQAHVLDWQIRTIFGAGCAGVFVFSWTDEWYRGGHDIDDWDFGLMTRERRPKPALAAVRKAFAEVPIPRGLHRPKISVIVCTYNGHHTIGECLGHLQKLEYPNYEVIVVDDGSDGGVPKVAGQDDVRVIRVENGGLAKARNIGMEAASGEIVAYIDDDAYPDPHWLTYLAHTFMTTDYAGVGGPNIPPGGGGIIAECVAKSPGGPAHVLVSDREAEHIPGCNMAFRRTCLQEIGGFDPQFRVAGDDVDVCWQLQNLGWKLGFSPAAVVWHHRRKTVRAYWNQQKGYGKAEALLERKWPEKYNLAGHSTWAGRVYGNGLTHPIGCWGRVYHGVWGTAPFQVLHERAPGLLHSLPLMPEWYLVVISLSALLAIGLLWKPLLLALPLLAFAVGVPFVRAALSATRSCAASPSRSLKERVQHQVLVSFLHLFQPLARLEGRLRYGITPWRRRGVYGLALPWPQTFTIWSERWKGAEERLRSLEGSLRENGTAILRGSEYDRWELEVRGGLLGAVRIRTAIEEHGGGRQLIRFRSWPHCSRGGLGMTLLFAALSTGAAMDQGWTASAILGVTVLLLALRIFQDCAYAMGTVLRALKHMKAGDG